MEQRIKKRLKLRKNKNIYIFLIIFFIIGYFFFSNDISVDEKTGKIKIEKKEVIKTEKFEKTYTGVVYKGLPFDLDIDLNDIYLTGTTIDLYFSNNEYYKLYKPYTKENINKIRYGFMLGKVRNRYKVFWLGKNLNSLTSFNFKLKEVKEDDVLGFRVVNLEGSSFFVKLVIKGKRIIPK